MLQSIPTLRSALRRGVLLVATITALQGLAAPELRAQGPDDLGAGREPRASGSRAPGTATPPASSPSTPARSGGQEPADEIGAGRGGDGGAASGRGGSANGGAGSTPTAHKSWARVGSNGARVRRLFDQRAEEFRVLEPGTVVSVHDVQAAWRLVSVPGGLRGWIYSRYVKPYGADQLVVDAEQVNFRVRPNTTDNEPLEPDRLHKGDLLLKLDEVDGWYEVQTGPAVRGWVSGEELEALKNESEAESTFASQQDAFYDGLVGSLRKVQQERAYLRSDEYALTLVRPIDADRDTELKRGAQAELDPFEARYQALITVEASPALRRLVEARLEDLRRFRIEIEKEQFEADLQESLRKIRDEAEEQERQARQELLREQQAKRDRDRIGSRWQHFGWVRSEGGEFLSSGPVRYVLERGDRPTLNLKCESGRYDLSDYVGREIAILGTEVGNFRLPVFEVEKIRILTNGRR